MSLKTQKPLTRTPYVWIQLAITDAAIARVELRAKNEGMSLI